MSAGVGENKCGALSSSFMFDVSFVVSTQQTATQWKLQQLPKNNNFAK